MSDQSDDDDTVEIPNLRKRVLEENQKTLDEGEQLLDGLNTLSAPERAWLEWFYSLSEEGRNIVEICGERDISVTAANFDQMKAIVKAHYAKDWKGLTE